MKAQVYFVPLEDGVDIEAQSCAMAKAYKAVDTEKIINADDFVAIKLHVGEKKNTTHIKPALIKCLVDKIYEKKGLPFLTETSTLYKGERENAIKHIMHAHRHGFGIDAVGAPFIMSDGLAGNTEYEIEINGELYKSVKIAREIVAADAVLVVSHPTGHPASGLGACLKILGMGLASRMGKMRQHSSMLPEIKDDKCIFCRKCMQWCPQNAIVERNYKAFILAERCIGCGECLAVCHSDAVNYDWNTESAVIQCSIAEYAYGVAKAKQGRSVYFNVMVDMTKNCDCFSTNQEKIIPDIGILASLDPVAIDKATLDITAKAHGKTLAELSHGHLNAMVQIEHAVKLGMGSAEYELIKIE